MTVRIKFVQKTGEHPSRDKPWIITDVYKVSLIDVNIQGFLLLKSHKNNRCSYAVGDTYLCDKIKLYVNQKSEIVLTSTSLTVLSSESDDSMNVESLELSQKQHDEDFFAGNEMLAVTHGESKAINFIMLEEGSTEPPIFTSIKQINTRSKQILEEWSHSPELTPKLWSFKEILCWKIPDHVLSTTARESQQKLRQKQDEEGYICSYAMHTHLYQLDMVT